MAGAIFLLPLPPVPLTYSSIALSSSFLIHFPHPFLSGLFSSHIFLAFNISHIPQTSAQLTPSFSLPSFIINIVSFPIPFPFCFSCRRLHRFPPLLSHVTVSASLNKQLLSFFPFPFLNHLLCLLPFLSFVLTYSNLSAHLHFAFSFPCLLLTIPLAFHLSHLFLSSYLFLLSTIPPSFLPSSLPVSICLMHVQAFFLSSR